MRACEEKLKLTEKIEKQIWAYRTVICLAATALVLEKALLPSILFKPAKFNTVRVPFEAIFYKFLNRNNKLTYSGDIRIFSYSLCDFFKVNKVVRGLERLLI